MQGDDLSGETLVSCGGGGGREGALIAQTRCRWRRLQPPGGGNNRKGDLPREEEQLRESEGAAI